MKNSSFNCLILGLRGFHYFFYFNCSIYIPLFPIISLLTYFMSNDVDGNEMFANAYPPPTYDKILNTPLYRRILVYELLYEWNESWTVASKCQWGMGSELNRWYSTQGLCVVVILVVQAGIYNRIGRANTRVT